jgi:hypothetical protein
MFELRFFETGLASNADPRDAVERTPAMGGATR